METTTEVIKLSNPTRSKRIDKILSIIGKECHFIREDWGDPDMDDEDVDTRYEFPESAYKKAKGKWIAVLGDDAMGSVTGAYMFGKKLILIANFGDDGNCEFDASDRMTEIYITQNL